MYKLATLKQGLCTREEARRAPAADEDALSDAEQQRLAHADDDEDESAAVSPRSAAAAARATRMAALAAQPRKRRAQVWMPSASLLQLNS